jgi:hypothetical protein
VTTVPAIWIGASPVYLVRNLASTDQEFAVPGVTVHHMDSGEATTSGNWATMIVGTVVADPANFGIDASGRPYYDPAGPAAGEAAVVTASGDSIPGLKDTVDAIFAAPGPLASRIAAASSAAAGQVVTITLTQP